MKVLLISLSLLLSFSAFSIEKPAQKLFEGHHGWFQEFVNRELIWGQLNAEIRRTHFKNCDVHVSNPDTDLIRINNRNNPSLDIPHFNVEKFGTTRRGIAKDGYLMAYKSEQDVGGTFRIHSRALGPFQSVLFINLNQRDKIKSVDRVDCDLTNGDDFEFSGCKLQMRCLAE